MAREPGSLAAHPGLEVGDQRRDLRLPDGETCVGVVAVDCALGVEDSVDVLAAEAIFADDTPIRMLAPATGRTQTARLWTYARDERPWGGAAAPAAWYRFSGDRKGQHPKDHLARFRG